MCDPLIRRANLSDADDLATCIEAAYARYRERIPDLPAVSEGIEAEIERNQVWVVLEGIDIVGGLFLIAQPDHLKLANLAVHPAHGGKGIGRQLIALAEQEASRQEYEEMRLVTHVLMPENIAIYAHLGWGETERSGNSVLMRKRLGVA